MPNQEHICIAITKSNMGGAQKYVFTLAKQLHLEGRKVTVLAGGDGLLFKELDELSIPYIKLKNSERDISISREIDFIKELYSILKEIRPTVLHLNSSKMGVIGTIVAKVCRIPRIITAHGWAFNENRPLYQKWIFYILYWLIILFTNKTICVSKQTRKQISFLPGVKNKTTVIYNAIEPPLFLETQQAKAKLHSMFPYLEPQKNWLGVIAELHPIKGHDLLIEAVSQSPHLFENYQIICLGSGQLEDSLKKQISQKNLEIYIYFTGFVTDASLYMKAFESIILPSRSEALPLTLLEAGCAESVVLASAVGGIPEIITDSETGFLFQANHMPELFHKLQTIVSLSPERRIHIGEQLHAYITQNFSLESMILHTKAVYNLE